MTRGQDLMMEQIGDLRRAFDQAFSEPPKAFAESSESLVGLGTDRGAYAVRLAEITGLFVDRPIVRLPSSVSEFLGVSGLRHDVVPVYSLGGLLGERVGAHPPRWMLVARAAHPVAFAFEQFHGYLRVGPSDVLPSKDPARPAHLLATVRLPDGLRSVVSIGSLLKAVEDRVRDALPLKEQ